MVSSTVGSETKTGWKRRAKCGVLLDVLAVFVERGGADAVQFTTRQRRFEQVRCVHGTIGRLPAPTSVCISSMNRMILAGRAGTSDRTAFRRSSNSPRYFAPAISAPMSSTISLLSLQAFRHIALHDAQGQTFSDGGLADTRFADQHRVVLGAARQDLDRTADFLVAADDRVELAITGRLCQITGDSVCSGPQSVSSALKH